MKKEILVIDNGLEIFEAVRNHLQDESTQVFHAPSVADALIRLRTHHYCLIMLDVLLSDGSGNQIITEIRKLRPMPIFVLSEQASATERIMALKCGADDCMEKSDDFEECLVRAQTLLRRYTELNHLSQHGYAVVSHEGLLLDTASRIVSVDGNEVSLSPKEYSILLYLLKNRNHIMSFEQIYTAVWNQPFFNDNATIFYHVGNLRKKLGSPDWIESIYGVGYRLKGLGVT